MNKYIKNYFKYLFRWILIIISLLFIIIAFLNMINPVHSLIFSKLESIIPGIYNRDTSSVSYSVTIITVDIVEPIIESTPRLIDSIILGIAVYTIIVAIRDLIPKKGKSIKKKKYYNVEDNNICLKNNKIPNIKNFTLVSIGIIASLSYYLIYLLDDDEVGKAVSDTLALIALSIVILKYVGIKQEEYLEDRKNNFKSLISKLFRNN